MTSNIIYSAVGLAHAPTKDDIVEWTIKTHISTTMCGKVRGIANNLDGSENALIYYANKLPSFIILYGNINSDEDIFISDSDSSNEVEDEVDS